MAELQLIVDRMKIKTIIEDFREGRLVIPEFQRAYVWKKKIALPSYLIPFTGSIPFPPCWSGIAMTMCGHEHEVTV